ncbi:MULTISPECIES: cation diffusion facilitator family transporter [Zymobacter]|uniref:Predicted Co/Zn/Cd cation transporters n=1 Tax=Zymobacter palmae TaxID=33074 RepID=A0A348HGS6_9GAMM|nr:cation transporter [Zymobacter palmae]BBG30828.1 predicted Co/Zn/Cd cation transporters [Zymobacter palmae]
MNPQNPIELRLLKQSTIVMALVALIDTVFGIAAASQSILFDGLFSAVAAAIKMLMFITARLIPREGSPRFQYGYWHLEPIALLVESGFLLVLAIYAMTSGIVGVMSGGHTIDFGIAAVYAAVCALVELSYFFYLRHWGQRIGSLMVRYDTASWLMDAILSLGLLISFVGAWALSNTRLGWITPYLDPIILMAAALFLIPGCFKMLKPALRDILEIVPRERDEQVQAAMSAFVAEHGLSGYTSYIQKSGRALFIEINVLVPLDYPIDTIDTFDQLRYEIADRLGEDTPGRWLTITFTGDRYWAD